MGFKLSVVALATAAMISGCQPAATDTVVSNVVVEVADLRFDQLAQNYFDDGIDLNPLMGTYIGRAEYNNHLANTSSDEYLAKSKQINAKYLTAVTEYDRSTLTAQQQLSRDILQYELEIAIEGEQFAAELLPMNQFYSKVITFVQLGSGQSAQPFATVEDFENFISRIDDFVVWLDSAQARMDQGIEQGVVLPTVLVEKLIPQLSALVDVDLQDSPFYSPLVNLSDAIPESAATPLRNRYHAALANKLMPAIAQLRDYFTEVYLGASRQSHGWGQLPNGAKWYQHLANKHTTTELPVAEIHQLGLEEVARILAEMDKVRAQVGFEGDLAAFFEYLGSDPQFFFAKPEQLVEGYSEIRTKINTVLPQYFDVMPKADYVVKAVEPFREKSAAGASYQAPAPDGSRPGVFYVNTYNLKAQPKWGMTTLSLHEASPGHHFQIAIKQELEGIPSFQRFGGYTAFEEGWALYSEYLGIEMGLFDDPYQYFGKLSDEMLRAMRLVVDTGLHAKGWSREQAIQYMLDNSPLAETDVIAEVERYMAIPGQALSYKVGQLTILRLRADAEAQLGDKFDLRDFHNQVLSSGSLPMALLENKIDLWVKQQQSA
ncbi:DUF885 domain-containing protein [Ferrimonas lipolytica]|uniref:DUF885 domain-containing protein n=1 Tax=Ferrimonas lipolytica TaxID=2724191 RepID=A0A6H1UG43_9GAMM|nr:DUF885 domain-containing protein [Ferrimonas lipolytica]QIZ77186.1 DUF885 domain-containing protein [Ferrimonas lipolytica]